MRINVYNEELTDEISLVHKDAVTGTRYYGTRLYLKSPPGLHTPSPENNFDDDRSAVTLWFGDRDVCVKVAKALANALTARDGATGSSDPPESKEANRVGGASSPLGHRWSQIP